VVYYKYILKGSLKTCFSHRLCIVIADVTRQVRKVNKVTWWIVSCH